MATIKSSTDLQQSRKLAEILPLESADMYYMETSCNNYTIGVLQRLEKDMLLNKAEYYKMFPCWSLAALFGVLPMIRKCKDIANPFIAKTPDNEYYVVYATLTEEVDSSSIYDNPVDACVTMIERLHELNLL